MELNRTRKREAGFSAIETLAALCVLTIGITAVSTGLTEGRRIATEADRRQRAVWLAYDKMTEKLALSYHAAGAPGGTTERVADRVLLGEDEEDGITRRWWVEEDWSAPGIVRVSVVTQWTRRGKVQTYVIGGLVASGLTP